MKVIATSEIFYRPTPETENSEVRALVLRKAMHPVRSRLPGRGSLLSALSDTLSSTIHRITGFDIRVSSSLKSAMLLKSSLREAVARLLDSLIVMTPLGLAALMLQHSGAENLHSTLGTALVSRAAAFSGSIALFLAWGISYFMVSERLFGMTPGKAIAGVRGTGVSAFVRNISRSLLIGIAGIIQSLFNIIEPSLAIASTGKWPRVFNLLPKTALIQREPIPLPRSIIDVT